MILMPSLQATVTVHAAHGPGHTPGPEPDQSDQFLFLSSALPDSFFFLCASMYMYM